MDTDAYICLSVLFICITLFFTADEISEDIAKVEIMKIQCGVFDKNE